MAKPKREKHKAKRKARLKGRRRAQDAAAKKEKIEVFFLEADYFIDVGKPEKALIYINKILADNPDNADALEFLLDLGFQLGRKDLQLKAFFRLDYINRLKDEYLPVLIRRLVDKHRYEEALLFIERLLARLPRTKIPNKRLLRKEVLQVQDHCLLMIAQKEAVAASRAGKNTNQTSGRAPSEEKPVVSVKPAAKATGAASLPDDPDFRKQGKAFWQQPFILASINQAKSKRNFDTVTSREYGMVIVDEAHHLKNRNTLNWKLVNALKKRFLLLLTATPVENNLMELYNLVTLLKPGQLKTATTFREEFMSRGDPTSPQNRSRLRQLLSEVIIRNTRAVASINIPPRFARTLRIQPNAAEKANL